MEPVLTAECLSAVHNGTAYIRVLNYQPNSVILKKNLKIALLVFPSSVNSVLPFKKPLTKSCQTEPEISQEVLDDFIKDYKIKINDNLSHEKKYKLGKLLYNYKDVFARNISEMKTYEGFELELRPRNPHLRSYTRQYKLNENDRNEVSRQVNDLHKQNLIEPTKIARLIAPVFWLKRRMDRAAWSSTFDE